MSKPFASSHSPIVKHLIEAGIIPALSTKFTLTANVNEPIRMTSECFVTEEQFREIAEALLKNPEEAKRITRLAILHPRGTTGKSRTTQPEDIAEITVDLTERNPDES
jgi:hypothetical protein